MGVARLTISLPVAEERPTKDKAYRKYASGVDRSLSLFETALQEWADYISFLNRLLKVRGSPGAWPIDRNADMRVSAGATGSTTEYDHRASKGPRRKAPLPMSEPLSPLRCPPKGP